jgi:cytochrome c oxidase subunit I+III
MGAESLAVYRSPALANPLLNTPVKRVLAGSSATIAATDFSAATAIVAVPTAVQIFAWLATLAHGRPRWSVPMLYIFGFFFIFVIGGLTGVMLSIVPFDWQAHDSYFVVAHFHYVVAGALAFPMLAALYYWLPLLTGRTEVHRLSVPDFWLVFIGFNLTFFPHFVLGYLGMPRRYHVYPDEFQVLNVMSTAGASILGLAYVLPMAYFLWSLRYGAKAGRNPWGAAGLEWQTPSPPPTENFERTPVVTDEAYTYSREEAAVV